MKKKLILILSMVALLVCVFAISASADAIKDDSIYSNFVELPAFMYDFTNKAYGPSVPMLSPPSDYSPIISKDNIRFAYKDQTEDELFYVVFYFVLSEPEGNLTVVNLSVIQNYLINNRNVTDLESFGSFLLTLDLEISSEFVDYLVEISQNEGIQVAYDLIFNIPEEPVITEEDLIAQYNQGKTDGVTEYKESEEYSSSLQTEYTKGYGVGYEAYKDSAEYESALNTQFNLGSSTGVKNYLESEEYSNALQAEYDNGFEAATTEQEQQGAINILTTVLGISGALVLVLLGVYFFLGKKGKKRR